MGATWFVRNTKIQTDLNIPSFEDYTRHLARMAWDRATTSEHPIIRHLVKLDPNRPPTRIRVRRIIEAIE